MTSVAFIVVLSAVVVALMAVAVFMETGDTISEESRFAIPVFGESCHQGPDREAKVLASK